MRFVRITELSQSWNGRQVGAPILFLAINHGSSVRGCWKYMLSWESRQRRDQLVLPRSGLRTEKWLPFHGHSTRLLCSCCLSQWFPCCHNFCFKWPLCSLVPLFPLQVLQAARTCHYITIYTLCLVSAKKQEPDGRSRIASDLVRSMWLEEE